MKLQYPIELEEAVRLLTNQVCTQGQILTVPLERALGYHAARDIYAPIDVPTFNRAGVDGYALLSGRCESATMEKPVVLCVQDELMAGDFRRDPVDDAQCVRIMTGAPIPNGLDAVIRQEETNQDDGNVEVFSPVKPFANYGRIGEDISKGRLVISAFTKLAPVHIGVLASLGLSAVDALCLPRVGLLSSGSELAQLGQPLAPGQIYCSNRHYLAAKLCQLGAEVVLSEQHRDDVDEFAALIERSVGDVDFLITTGAVSVGKKDIMHDVIRKLGAKQLFWRINMRPGTPVLASMYRGKPILSLSGNPLAALTTFELLFRPMLCAFLGSDAYASKRNKAVLMNDLHKENRQRRFVGARYEDGRVWVGSLGKSSVLSNMLDCNCMIDIEADTPMLQKGSTVEVIML
ncbi:MAG: molybdopterin molybdotransferase MoeA [Defluviitaleaceae bacterium]|nr:molybdopterin molybdotransferase MoeA [Defluviitaleaceae bacterium]